MELATSKSKVHHLEDLLKDAEVKPMINQVEYHPRLTQTELKAFCQANDIQLEVWSPLMQGQLLDHPTLVDLATKHKKTVPQIILRWDLQNGVVIIPKSTKEQRIMDNSNVFDFELLDEDIERIDSLNQNLRVGPDPDNIDF